MRRKVTIVLATGAALAAAGLALAQVQDRISLRATGGNALAHYSPTLAAVVVSPPEYTRGCCYDSNGGEWTGPRYQATGLASLGADSKYDWTVGVAVRAGDTRAGLIANLTQDWPVVSEGQQQVEHRVGGRAGGSTGFGEYRINGMRPSDWNAEKAMQSIRGIRLEGNRPAARVTAAARGRRVSGRVADCDAHPLAGLAVQLQRRTGRSWRTVSSARTSAGGTYSLAARSAGTYRVRAGTRTSASLRVR